MAHLGEVVLFLQYTSARFHVGRDFIFTYTRCRETLSQLSSVVFRVKDRDVRSDVVFAGSVVHRFDQKGFDVLIFHAWFKALFDSNSEGIEDTILR